MKRKKSAVGLPALTRRWRADVGEYVRKLAPAPSGGLLAVATAADEIPLLDAATGATVHLLPGHAGGVTSLAWHPKRPFFASTGHDGHVRYWDAKTGQQLWANDTGTAWVECVAFRPDGKLLAVAAGRHGRLFQPDGVLARIITDHPSTVADIAWRPDRDELIVARYGGLTVWSPGREQPVKLLNYRGSVLRIAVSPTGRFVATADQNSTVHFWRTKTWQDAEMSGYPHIVTSLSWDSTGRYLATDGGEDGMVWDCSDPGPEGRMPTFLKGDTDRLTRCVAFGPDRAVCAVAGESGTLTIHDVTNPTRIDMGNLGGSVTALAWGLDRLQLFAGGASGQVEAYAEH